MRLELKGFGLKIFNSVFIYIGFSKCGPSHNPDKFYKTDYGVVVGYEEYRIGDKNFNII